MEEFNDVDEETGVRRSSTDSEESDHRDLWALFFDFQILLLLFVMVLRAIGFGIIIPTLPYLARSLDAGSFEMGLTITIFSVAQFLSSPYTGSWSDRAGHKQVMILGLYGYGLAMIGAPFSPNVLTLLALRAIAGVALAAANPSSRAYAVEITSGRERSVLLGWMAGAGGVGFMLGPGIGGVLAPIHIAVPFVVAGVAAVGSGVLSYFALPKITASVPEEKITTGTPSSFITLIRELLSGSLSVLLWTRFGAAFAAGAIDSMLGYFLIDQFDASEFVTGFVFTLRGAMLVFSQAVLVAPLVTFLGEHGTVILALTLGAIGYYGLGVAPSLIWVFVMFGVVSMGVAVVRPLLLSVSSEETGHEQGTTMGLMVSMTSLGRATGPMWAGFIFNYAASGPFVTSAGLYAVLLGLFFWRYHSRLGYSSGTYLSR